MPAAIHYHLDVVASELQEPVFKFSSGDMVGLQGRAPFFGTFRKFVWREHYDNLVVLFRGFRSHGIVEGLGVAALVKEAILLASDYAVPSLCLILVGQQAVCLFGIEQIDGEIAVERREKLDVESLAVVEYVVFETVK